MGSSLQESDSGTPPPDARSVAVCVAAPIDKTYDYRLPVAENTPPPGTLVRVPIGKRSVVGVVMGPGQGGISADRVRDIETIFSGPPLAREQLAWMEAMARYTLTPIGLILELCVAGVAALVPPRRAVKEKSLPGIPGAGSAQACNVALNPEQQAAAHALCSRVADNRFSVTLVFGVTGSGKTETYFEAVAAALQAGGQILILMPEIALTTGFADRFRARFGFDPALWHSGVGVAAKKRVWKGVLEGRVRVVVGARSALFLPFPSLGLVVIDEEHDPAYKQEDGVVYHARDMAVLRASYASCPVVLVSATPSVETMVNVWSGKYSAVMLHARFGEATMPETQIIDMRAQKLERGNFVAEPLWHAVANALALGEQALLFLNRRGYAPLTLCRSCGHRITCPQCTAWLVQHQRTGRLSCHHCGYGMRIPVQCPECSADDSLTACGPGVERVADECRARFPDARLLVLASDTLENADALRAALRQIENHEVDCIIGTQIIAKGHHFPRLSFVGVVDADLGLAGGDLRASERTFQMLHQVAGRAGRERTRGHVQLQTFAPDHPVLKVLAAGDVEAFLRAEAHEREHALMPPYGRLVAVILSSLKEAEALDAARALARAFPARDDIRLFGPAPAPLYRIRGRYRQRLLIQAYRSAPVQDCVRAWLAAATIPSRVRLQVDVDPHSFL